jgi:hypothetical protein
MITGKISKRLCTSGMPSSGLNENLRTGRNFLNLPDQILISSSELMTADFCMTDLGTLCSSERPGYVIQNVDI